MDCKRPASCRSGGRRPLRRGTRAPRGGQESRESLSGRCALSFGRRQKDGTKR
jgi:hypothetical protein